MEEVVNEIEVVATEPPAAAPVVTEVEPKPGDKTEPNLLLKSLQEERAERKRLEAELEALKQNPTEPQGDVFSEEGKLLKGEIAKLEAKIAASETAKKLESVQQTYPALLDKQNEFDEFLELNPGMKIETAAKAFLVENDLLETPKPRKGLENASGGGRTPVVSEGMSAEEIDNLRNNNYREYSKRLRAGTLKIK